MMDAQDLMLDADQMSISSDGTRLGKENDYGATLHSRGMEYMYPTIYAHETQPTRVLISRYHLVIPGLARDRDMGCELLRPSSLTPLPPLISKCGTKQATNSRVLWLRVRVLLSRCYF